MNKQNEEKMELLIEEPKIPRKKIMKRVLNFDAYFQILMSKNSKIRIHHKAPMRKYAESKGVIEATKEDFDLVFRLY